MKSLKERAREDQKFMEAYTACGLPFPKHSKLSPGRQYGKYLRKTGLVWRSKNG